ncbi:MAG: cytochrome [Thermoleophilia bacterium]|nr:cytochrome [Thermoleophilia bacterium]
MRPLPTRLLAFAAVLVPMAVVAASCGGSNLDTKASSEPIDVDKGRALFQSTCRVCHALSDAKAAGVFGPDLDLLQPDAQRVRDQIKDGGGGMPDGLLDGSDADLVARYVAQVAGADPASEDGTTPPKQRGSTKANPDG